MKRARRVNTTCVTHIKNKNNGVINVNGMVAVQVRGYKKPRNYRLHYKEPPFSPYDIQPSYVKNNLLLSKEDIYEWDDWPGRLIGGRVVFLIF